MKFLAALGLALGLSSAAFAADSCCPSEKGKAEACKCAEDGKCTCGETCKCGEACKCEKCKGKTAEKPAEAPKAE